jgi:hypothetical protein
MLPEGMTMDKAAAGFRNQGQFIAALHVSQNLGIPFDQLKLQMVDHHQSLGRSIQTLKPSANAATETGHAETQAAADLGASGSATITTSTPTRTAKKPAKTR